MERLIPTSTRRDEINCVLKYLRQIKDRNALLMRLEPKHDVYGKGTRQCGRWMYGGLVLHLVVCCGWHAICARYGRAGTRKASRGRDNTKAQNKRAVQKPFI